MEEVQLGMGLRVMVASADTSLLMCRPHLDRLSRDTVATAGCSQGLEPLHFVDGQIRG